MTQALINGRLMPIEEARVSVLDRSFLYGDGVFETLRVFHGKPFRWNQHFDRLSAAAGFVGIPFRLTLAELRAQAGQLIQSNNTGDSVLRIHLSRGVGSRGYSPRDANAPTLVLTSHPAPSSVPAEVDVIVAPWRLPNEDALWGFKTANRLLNVMAREAADGAGAGDALLLNTRDEVCSASGANLFWIERNRLFTPPAEVGIRAGVTREAIVELGVRMNQPVAEERCSLDRLKQADAVFLTQSVLGIIGVSSVDGSATPSTDRITLWRAAYDRLVAAESAASPD